MKHREYYNDINDSNFEEAKYTDYISYNTAINILHTFDYARFCGRPLNVAVTINFYEDYNVPHKFKNIRTRLFRWMKGKRKKSGYPQDQFWAFSIEHPRKNAHVHFACHVEDELRNEFEEKLNCLTRQFSKIDKGNKILFQDIDILKDKVFANYMIKGVNPDTAKKLRIRSEYQGRVFGQRARSCMRLSRTARRRADFHAPIHRHLWVEKYPILIAGLSLGRWDESKVIPNASIVRRLANMFENFGEENEKLLDSGLKLKPTGYRRYRNGKTKSGSSNSALRRH